ncbi:unnamed protein product [Porites lobata]|uniref:Tesmin/TSO1-like CXC domain-containing protein n=1 Tax=Porites lobata TaxID=104759 RepID=A0ABN8P7R9_9CNID|nr:unnamed protein product [Porites lobata]
MGIIAAVTPATHPDSPIPRCSATAAEIANIGKIAIHYYKTANDVKVPLVYEKLPCLSNVNKTWKLDFLCSLVWPIRSPKPNWSGLMQTISKESHPGKSSVTFLPMIDMHPTNMSCIYSTLKFVEAQCKRQHTTPIITFDQPLWWKAQLIVESEPPDSELRSIILRLGGFHAEMSFLGCIGSIMSGSGIEELLECVYPSNTVGHMLSGKASQRAQWLFRCYASSGQHKEMTKTRQARDDEDSRALLGYLQERNPFDCDLSMRNISTGITADCTVNVDRAKEVGETILKSMVGNNVQEYTFKKKNHLVTMGQKKSIKVDGEPLQIDPQLLFQRLTTVAQNMTENVAELFQYEFCSQPSSLFDQHGLLREANKAQLADDIWTVAKGNEMQPPEIAGEMNHVIDGGSLLQRIPWKRDETFNSIAKGYVEYIQQKFTNPIVVFDGYNAGPGTKDTAHLRRTKGLTAVDSAANSATTVVGEDTDLLVLLCLHADVKSQPLFLKSEKKQTAKKNHKVWHINRLKSVMGPELCLLLPFVYAVSGSDTTSRLYGVGKGAALRKLRSDSAFKEAAYVFTRQSSLEEIVAAGEKALCCLYGGRPNEGLDVLRYRRFCEKVATSNTTVQVQSLPPTSAAARYHSARVYLQVQQWMGRGKNLNPEDWGWLRFQDRLHARTTDQPPAPDNLFKVIRCTCKQGCDSRRCSCRKFGIPCSFACSECRGVNCSNSSTNLSDVLVNVEGDPLNELD